MLSKLRIVAVTSICCASSLLAQNQTTDQSDKWQLLLQAIQNVLAGRSFESNNVIISPGAYLVFGDKFENLQSVVTGESETCSLKEDSTRGGMSVVVKMNAPEDAALIMLETQTNKKTDKRFHTVVFMKDADENWIVHAWHTSN